VFENEVLSTSEPEKDDVAGGCGKLRNEKLHYLYSSTYIVIYILYYIKLSSFLKGLKEFTMDKICKYLVQKKQSKA
jgi:hypothetical protein